MIAPSSERPKVFVSYARSDSQFVLKLARDLREAGANLWVDQFDIPLGARWDRSVQAALNACPGFLVILSPSAVDSENVMDEVSFALSKNKKIVPVLYQNCDIPLRLTRLQYIDFTVDYDTGFPKLCKELGVDTISAQQPASLSQFKQTEPVALTPSFDKGLYGGFIGGAIAGLIVGILYYLASQNAPAGEAGIPLVLAILAYGAIVGATFGLCTQQAILWFALGALNKQSFRMVREAGIAGGVLGGAAAGVIAGALGVGGLAIYRPP
jgi:TIR domain